MFSASLSNVVCRSCNNLGNVANLVMCSACGNHHHGACIGNALHPGKYLEMEYKFIMYVVIYKKNNMVN